MGKLPVAIGLTLCEQVIIEEKTRNVTLVNCFSERSTSQFPSDPIPFTVFALLTDGLGEITLEVVVERLDTFEEVDRKSMTARFTDSVKTMRFIAPFRHCSFPIAGAYQVTLFANREFVAHRQIRVSPKEKSK